jgi:peptidoglycan/xylan/chitin deacetylase (PgdA/CDA1 family)
MKYKKLFIVIVTFIFVITITYSLYAAKSEAPKIIEGVTTINKDLQEKYIIINRSIVAPKNILNKKKIILLTIDDGPSKRTIEIMDILKKHNASAIFFINGINDKKNQGVIKQITKEGFTVGNHTWSHLNLKKEKDTNIINEEINKNGELINKETGSFPKFFRAPYGESNTYVRSFIKDNKMIMMDWSDSALDWTKPSQEKDIFVSNVINSLHSGSIILIHEHPWSVSSLDALLTTIESEGYTYVDPSNIIE